MVIEVDVHDGIATVTLNRPKARNALSAELVAAIDGAVAHLDGDEGVNAIILTGTDPAFCAGFDLRSLSTEIRDVQQRRQREPIHHLGMLPAHDTPVVGAVNGAAVTGGLELALACDFIVASDRARFADTHARVGAMPGGGLTIRLPQLIGINRARQMSFTGDFIDAATALDWGLVNEVVRHDELMERCEELAGTIASIPPPNIREVRAMYADVGELVGVEAWERESRRSRDWMAERFDQSRLVAERESIIQRGRSQI